MSNPSANDSAPRETSSRPGWTWIVMSGSVLLLLVALVSLRHGQHQEPTTGNSPATHESAGAVGSRLPETAPVSAHRPRSAPAPPESAEGIVARKLNQFGKSRRELVHALAKHFKVSVPDDVERFFAAMEGGRWEEIDAAFTALRGPHASEPRSPDLFHIWRPIQEAWGAAREAHNWPAQKLLDYGEAVLGSLRPGMVYAGGTDPGAFITSFLNETSEGDRRIVLTQNALASGPYLDYLNFLYGDRLATLTQEDSKRAFDEYAADARKRLEHDLQFPDEPKQLHPGENVRIVDGKVEVTGQPAVMALNEKLFQLLMAKNPDASFAIEVSFPFKSTFAGATPLGPIMELRAEDAQNVLTRERAAQSLDYWRAAAEQFKADADSVDSLFPRMAYAKMAAHQATLLQHRGYAAEAEQTLRLANEIGPGSPEAIFLLLNLLVTQGRINDGLAFMEAAQRSFPPMERLQPVIGDSPSTLAQIRNTIEELKRMQRGR